MRMRVVVSILLMSVFELLAGQPSVQLPAFDASISIGFNYDLLRTPTDVSFEYPRGYFGFNIPLKQTVNLRDFLNYIDPAIDSVFMDSSIFTNGGDFRPRGSARQNPNMSVQVDVPMMGGVASFSNTQNFYFKYTNVLGNPNVFIDTMMGDLNLLLRGTTNVPLNVSLGWETMTFGYAYRINQHLIMALNLHRHLFNMNLRANIDVDLLGRFKFESSAGGAGGISIDHELNYPSTNLYGEAYGHYESEVWTPTIGIKAWRFTLTSRFGLSTRAKGLFYAKYTLPFFIHPETFELFDMSDPELINDAEFRQNLFSNALDSISYSTLQVGDRSGLLWKMPTGLTMAFDIFPEHFRISYTKIFGDIQMKFDPIAREKRAVETGSNRPEKNDTLVIDLGVTVDHVLLLHINVFNAFLNMGVFGIDFRYAERKNLIGSNMPYMHMGEMAMLPALSFGSAIGSKLQLLLELDVLPLPALKTGIFYYF